MGSLGGNRARRWTAGHQPCTDEAMRPRLPRDCKGGIAEAEYKVERASRGCLAVEEVVCVVTNAARTRSGRRSAARRERSRPMPSTARRSSSSSLSWPSRQLTSSSFRRPFQLDVSETSKTSESTRTTWKPSEPLLPLLPAQVESRLISRSQENLSTRTPAAECGPEKSLVIASATCL